MLRKILGTFVFGNVTSTSNPLKLQPCKSLVHVISPKRRPSQICFPLLSRPPGVLVAEFAGFVQRIFLHGWFYTHFSVLQILSHKYYTLITTIWSYTLRPLTILTRSAFVTTFYNFCPETDLHIFITQYIQTYLILTYFGLNSALISITNLQLSLTYMLHTTN